MTEATTVGTTKVGSEQARQFQDVFTTVIPFTVLLTEASIATHITTASGISAGAVTVTGAELGDFVLLAPEVDVIDLVVTAQVTAANTVSVVIGNFTGTAVTALSAGVTFNGVVLKAGHLFDAPAST